MYAAGTGIKRYIVGKYNDRFAFNGVERMAAFGKFHIFAFAGAKHVAQIFLAYFANLFQKFFGKEQNFAFTFNPGIFNIRMQGNGNVGRHGPRSGCPDYHIGRFAFCCFRHHAVVFYNRHFYVNSRSFLFSVFNFCFCQSGFAVRAPVNGFLAFIDIAFFSHFAEYMNLYGFVIRNKGYIGMIPVAQNAKAFKIVALNVNPLQSVVFAFVAQYQRVKLVAVQAKVFNGSMFNRHAVGIPAGNVRSIITLGIFIFHDDVF